MSDAPVPPARIDLDALGFDEGAHLIVRHALASLPAGATALVRGSHPALAIDLRAFCRAEGHDVASAAGGLLVTRRAFADARWTGAARAGAPPLAGVVDEPSPSWGLAARGALVEAGDLGFHFPLARKADVWADEAARLYEQAVAAQWSPADAIDWQAARAHPPELEDAVVQVMTYLIENETAALLVPARFLAQLHPHFREVMQLLAVQAADEARHVEVFTRRAALGGGPARSTQGGQASLKTLVDEPDFAIASFLLSVLGEGTFLALLWFLHAHGPDAVTRDVARLAAQDEARHVAFGLAHLARHAAIDPGLRGRLAAAVERRHAALSTTPGLDPAVHDSLILLAAGSYQPAAVARGWRAVQELVAAMADGRRARLVRLGFSAGEADALSALHTRNFM
ncbi:MAG TPA: hypothetical protein VHE35_35345 [Kofleriaceae bacterium]|nr:hypothetical protein [Kofleriaceae bacterium]